MWGIFFIAIKLKTVTFLTWYSALATDAEYFDFFMYSHSYSFADLSTPNTLLKLIHSKNRQKNNRYLTIISNVTEYDFKGRKKPLNTNLCHG